jgi:hypothetical protein
MSAFVAFNGFPGQDVQDPIGTLLLQQKQAPVSVPAKPVHLQVLATRRGASASTAQRHGSVRNVRTPRASTGPVVERTSPTPTAPTPGQTPSSPGQSPTSVAGSTPTVPISTTTPSAPDTGITLPPITLPSLPPPPGGSPQQLPIDTSGVTSLLGGG